MQSVPRCLTSVSGGGITGVWMSLPCKTHCSSVRVALYPRTSKKISHLWIIFSFPQRTEIPCVFWVVVLSWEEGGFLRVRCPLWFVEQRQWVSKGLVWPQTPHCSAADLRGLLSLSRHHLSLLDCKYLLMWGRTTEDAVRELSLLE